MSKSIQPFRCPDCGIPRAGFGRCDCGAYLTATSAEADQFLRIPAAVTPGKNTGRVWAKGAKTWRLVAR